MEELTTRPYDALDAPRLAAFLNLLDDHAGGSAGYTPEEIGPFLATVVGDLPANTRLSFGPDGELVTAAVVAPPPDGGYRCDLDGGVHPSWRGRGLGREILAWQLHRAGEIHTERAPGAAWEVHSSVMAGDHDSQRLFNRFGMAPIRYWFEMKAPLTPLPSVASSPVFSVPAGLRTARYLPEQEKALHAAHCAAFVDHFGFQARDVAAWASLTVELETFLPEHSVVAFDGEELVGYVLSYRDAAPSRLYIGQVGVRAEWRRRGLAAALLTDVLASAGADGFDSVVLGVDADSPTGAVSVYEKVGFTVEHRGVTYSLSLGPSLNPSPALAPSPAPSA